MSGPPRRPSGPPPPRVVSPDAEELGGIKRPPGPPPGAPPLMTIKPPPGVSPPADLDQSGQRPGVSPIKKPGTAASPDVSLKRPPEDPPDVAPAKKQSVAPAPSYKPGGISMFEGGEQRPRFPPPSTPPPDAPPGAAAAVSGRPRMPPPRMPPPRMAPQGVSADPSLPMGRAPRPLPPRPLPPGIPEGQPLPPSVMPEKESRPPAPIKPPPLSPEGGRVPPKDDPDGRAKRGPVPSPGAPTTQPPLKREKKAKEHVILKRRERDMPEMESSDEEEEPPPFVQQPLPFGVLKQDLPKPQSALKVEEKKEEVKEEAKPEPTVMGKSVRIREGDFPDGGSVSTRGSLRTRESSQPPLSAPTQHTDANEFVPVAPPVMDKHFDDSELGRYLNRGRLVIKCLHGVDIRRKDDNDRNPRNDPYIRFRLGVAERHAWKSTEVQRKQGSRPDFGGEIVSFNVLDPIQYVFQEDVQLCIELWNKSLTKNELVGSVTMSVVRFMRQPFTVYSESIPLYYSGATRSSMKLALEIVFEEAKSGLAQITVFEATGLRNIDPMGRQDPYVQLSLGKHYKKRTKCIKGGGVEPYFDEEEVLLWLDQDNWVEDLLVEVLDEDTKEEKPIASTFFSLLPYMKIHPNSAKENEYPLFYYELIDPKDDSEKRQVACGSIILRVRFLPAGKLTAHIERAKGLLLPETISSTGKERLDPYVQLTLDGAAVQIVKRTPADKDGGADPIWEHSIQFDVVDQYTMSLQVMNQGFVGMDTLIGYAEISLLPVFRNGASESWTTLRQRRPNGGIREVGDIFIKLNFSGPTGISFPQLQDNIDAFDDTLRKAPGPLDTGKKGEEVIEAKPIISTIPTEDNVPLEEALKAIEDAQESNAPPEFTEEEIVAAFRFIDLDRNNYVGAGEIRHILVCMGEMITDEEIDMMISMVDVDGDGQVSFKEFRTLVLHPNPAIIDMHKEVNKEKDNDMLREKQAMAGKSQGLDLNSFQRQKEMLAREEKKKMILNFIADNDADFEYIKQAYLDYADLPKEKKVGGRVKFPEFCQVMRVEPIMEYRSLHAFYDDEELGDMDLREFLLSMMNYVSVAKDDRIQFSFIMFDEMKTGFISQKEVEEILRGNHMLSLMSVRKKAETVMRQAHSDRMGYVNLKEFLIVSKKFPNILFPTSGVTNIPKGVRTATSKIEAIPG